MISQPLSSVLFFIGSGLIVALAVFFLLYRKQKVLQNSKQAEKLAKEKKQLKKREEAVEAKEKALQELVNQVPYKIFAKDKDGNFLFANQALAEGYGLTPEEIKGKNQLQLHQEDNSLPIEEVKKFIKDDKEVIESGEPKFISAETNHEHNGEVQIVETTKVPFQISALDKQAVVGIAIDISRQKEMKKELEASYEQLEAYNQELKATNQELDAAYKRQNKLASNFEKMIDIMSNLGKETLANEKVLLSDILRIAIEIVPEADYGSIYLFEGEEVQFIDAVGHDLSNLKKLEVDSNYFSNVQRKVIIISDILNNTIKGNQVRHKMQEASKSIKETMTVGLTNEQEIVGGFSLDIDINSDANFTEESKRTIKALGNLANVFFALERYSNLQQSFQKEMIIAVTKMLEIHDKYTKGHSQNVARMAEMMAEEMGLSQEQVDETYWTGMVHDIGKTVVPHEILNKKGSLTTQEYKEIKKHPEWGYKTLTKSEQLTSIAQYVRYHHERWDGTGYPEGLAGEEIPLISRIIGVVDAWDAMRSNRPYRDALSRELAIKEIKENKGSQFAPAVVEVFLEIIDRIEINN